MAIASEYGMAHQGNAQWLADNRDAVSRIYLVPVLKYSLKANSVRCIVLLVLREGSPAWMTLDVNRWRLLRLKPAAAREVVELVGELAARYPVVKWDGSLGGDPKMG
ncbi:hypothetical protein [Kitasatospora sp. GP82]|uniref:hypothetical protein n=1 Tax=Kitasatospora sp. GP82 TaxID=3035089 RepID=UPI0024751894|nr:hypothetical protein [Kitasatospora sp. GP82]MDH6125508.1 hypothetical protein [Kitasatospora sp. GP82]